MKVILDHEKNPRGVFLPVEEWETLKYGISTAHQLYKLMDDLSHRDVFDLTPEQFSEQLHSAASMEVEKALDNGFYLSYPASAENTFVHRYKDDSSEEVQIDINTGKERVIRRDFLNARLRAIGSANHFTVESNLRNDFLLKSAN